MEDLKQELKRLIVQSIELDDVDPNEIDSDAPLFGAGLGLDSIDALELGVALKKKYNVKFSAEVGENKKHFASVSALANYIAANR